MPPGHVAAPSQVNAHTETPIPSSTHAGMADDIAPGLASHCIPASTHPANEQNPAGAPATRTHAVRPMHSPVLTHAEYIPAAGCSSMGWTPVSVAASMVVPAFEVAVSVALVSAGPPLPLSLAVSPAVGLPVVGGVPLGLAVGSKNVVATSSPWWVHARIKPAQIQLGTRMRADIGVEYGPPARLAQTADGDSALLPADRPRSTLIRATSGLGSP